MRNVMMNISWSNTAKLTRLVEALNEHSRAWREVMNKEGDVPEAVGTCGYDYMNERHLVKQGGSTASAHLQGGSGWIGWHRVTTLEEGAVSRVSAHQGRGRASDEK